MRFVLNKFQYSLCFNYLTLYIQDIMASDLATVPALRALAFNHIVKRYRRFENKGREDQLVLLLSQMPVTLIPELVRRKAAAEAVDAADDVKEVVKRFSNECSGKTMSKWVESECEICDHVQELEVEVHADSPDDEQLAAEVEITRERDRKRQKLDASVLLNKVCPDYGFEPED